MEVGLYNLKIGGYEPFIGSLLDPRDGGESEELILLGTNPLKLLTPTLDLPRTLV